MSVDRHCCKVGERFPRLLDQGPSEKGGSRLDPNKNIFFFQEQHLGSKARDHTFNLVWQPCSRHQRNHFAMMPHAGGVGTSGCRHQAQGRPPWLPMHRDGDLIPSSMTICLAGYSPRIVTFLALKDVRLLICGWATAVLRVGGWSTCFFRNASGIKLGPIPL